MSVKKLNQFSLYTPHSLSSLEPRLHHFASLQVRFRPIQFSLPLVQFLQPLFVARRHLRPLDSPSHQTRPQRTKPHRVNPAPDSSPPPQPPPQPPLRRNLSSWPTYLYLSHNLLNGKFPAGISNLLRLLRLDLSHNKFSGEIPVTELTQSPTFSPYDSTATRSPGLSTRASRIRTQYQNSTSPKQTIGGNPKLALQISGDVVHWKQEPLWWIR